MTGSPQKAHMLAFGITIHRRNQWGPPRGNWTPDDVDFYERAVASTMTSPTWGSPTNETSLFMHQIGMEAVDNRGHAFPVVCLP